MLVQLSGGPLDLKRVEVKEVRYYYWFPVFTGGGTKWYYYYLDTNQRRLVERKEQPKSKKRRPVASYFFDGKPARDVSNCDVQTFLKAYEGKHGIRPSTIQGFG